MHGYMEAIVQVINAISPFVRIWGVKQTDICHALPSNCNLNFVFNAFISELLNVLLIYPQNLLRLN